jgi:hypothetical protein
MLAEPGKAAGAATDRAFRHIEADTPLQPCFLATLLHDPPAQRDFRPGYFRRRDSRETA